MREPEYRKAFAAWRGSANWPRKLARGVEPGSWRHLFRKAQPSIWGVGLAEGRLVAQQFELNLAERAANDR